MAIAIVTGASSGLGTAYVEAVTQVFPEIDELWLIARREDRLRQVAAKYPDKKCVIIPLDLSDMESIGTLRAKLDKETPEVRLLVHDAGVCISGNFESMPIEKALSMIDLNCKGSVAVTKTCLPYVADGGTIVEVSSTSAFVPNTGMVLYGATKSLVYEMCIGLKQELKPRRINVCAVCPGMMATEMTVNPSKGQSRLPYVDVQKAAVNSLRAAKRGRAVYTTGSFYKFYRLLAKILPQTFMVKFAGL